MTDPNFPAAPEPTPAPAPAAPMGAPVGNPNTFPGKTLGIVGLVLVFFTSVIGLILSIVALVQSKKAGYKNTPALVGVILGIIFLVLAIIAIAAFGSLFLAIINNCPEVSPGQYVCSA